MGEAMIFFWNDFVSVGGIIPFSFLPFFIVRVFFLIFGHFAIFSISFGYVDISYIKKIYENLWTNYNNYKN